MTIDINDPDLEIVEITYDEYKLNVINSISDVYPGLRSSSKQPTFLLTYGGTHHGISDLGFSKEESKKIEDNYHDLYTVSDQWVASHVKAAYSTGYVECAFGLRVRTPTLLSTLPDSAYTPYQAKKEERTAGNALGQSWGLLNNRAAIELRQRIIDAGYRTKIIPIMLIHDAIYLICVNDLDIIRWLAKNISECMAWNDDPLIYHPEVGMEGELELFVPNWTSAIAAPEDVTNSQIRKGIVNALHKQK